MRLNTHNIKLYILATISCENEQETTIYINLVSHCLATKFYRQVAGYRMGVTVEIIARP